MVRKKGGGGVGGGLDDLTSHHLVLGQSYSSYANEAARFRTASAGSIAAGLNSLSTSATTATTGGHPVIQASCAKLDLFFFCRMARNKMRLFIGRQCYHRFSCQPRRRSRKRRPWEWLQYSLHNHHQQSLAKYNR